MEWQIVPQSDVGPAAIANELTEIWEEYVGRGFHDRELALLGVDAEALRKFAKECEEASEPGKPQYALRLDRTEAGVTGGEVLLVVAGYVGMKILDKATSAMLDLLWEHVIWPRLKSHFGDAVKRP